MKNRFCAVLLVVGMTRAGMASAVEWQTVGADKDAMGNDMRVLEIDPASIRAAASEVSVRARITDNSFGREGYNCSPGELRHGNVDKKIATAICSRASSPDPYGKHEAEWITLRIDNTRDSKMITKFDRNSVYRIKDEVMVAAMHSTVSNTVMRFDCKGYYKTGGQWTNLDMTDHIPTVPRGFVSLERQLSDRVCSGTR